MNINKHLKKFESIASVWLKALVTYDENNFARKPDDDNWSIGQVYYHLTRGTQNFHLRMVRQCIDNLTNAHEKKAFPGKIVFFTGSFPAIRVKVPPSNMYTPKQPESISEMHQELNTLIEVMRTVAQELSQKRDQGKTQHPRFGYLNGDEWFAMIQMHFRHHLHQKKRLDDFLKKGA